MLRRILVVIVAVPLAIFAFVTVSLAVVHRVRGIPFSYEHNGTDLTFASSDGGWRGEEDMLRGRGFEDVLLDFTLYRIRADRPEARLVRTKPWKHPWQWAWWFDRRSSPKWRVPFAEPAGIASAGDAPPPDRPGTAAEHARARREAEAYLRSLR